MDKVRININYYSLHKKPHFHIQELRGKTVHSKGEWKDVGPSIDIISRKVNKKWNGELKYKAKDNSLYYQV